MQYEVKSLKDAASDHKIKMLIYGPSGAGKTSLAGTLDLKTEYIGFENGAMPLHGKDIMSIEVSSYAEDPMSKLKLLEAVYNDLFSGKRKPKVVMLDSLTECSEITVEALQKMFPDRKDSLPMWGEYSKRMRSIVKKFRDLPMHVVMVCLSKPEKDENNKRYMGFDIAGSISNKLPQYFDEVFYLHVDDEGKRSLITNKTDKLICKDRSGKLEMQEPADLGLIMRKITMIEEIKK